MGCHSAVLWQKLGRNWEVSLGGVLGGLLGWIFDLIWGSQSAPREPQVAPNGSQMGPKLVPNAPRRVPKASSSLQMLINCPQMDPNGHLCLQAIPFASTWCQIQARSAACNQWSQKSILELIQWHLKLNGSENTCCNQGNLLINQVKPNGFACFDVHLLAFA